MTNVAPETLAAERRALLHYVTAVRRALTELRPGEMRARHLPTAMTEIGMIVETTESAANQIMQAAEEILGQPPETPPEAYRAFVEERCLSMMEACSFQDLTGQRIAKVVEMLLKLENKIGGLSELLGEGVEEEAPEPVRSGDEILLNGPAAPGEGVDQNDIDRLFA
ncbi:Chemotaxis phosphatase, CheZ (fragment) [uncultured Defluviicoccus sp.]|uniref:Chemotaxis phosphatase, CheZ n=1 Tax=metagenome TaxID=256318 RepID=A0A380T9E6_9ZZZZ